MDKINLGELIVKKAEAKSLTLEEYKAVIDYLMKKGLDDDAVKFFKALCMFGMGKDEVLNLSLAIRDSGKVQKFKPIIFEKHSTGGVGDSTSLVIIPLLASMGYKVIKTTGKSFVYTNGSADRFGSIPGFKANLTDDEIKYDLYSTNACILAHGEDVCPADRILYDFREKYGCENDLNLLVASIASKKLASGAKVVLVDVKYGSASVVKTYSDAKYVASVLRYIFKKCGIKCVIVITNTLQTIGEGIGNAIEVEDAIQVLQGKKCLLRDISALYTAEMICASDKRLKKRDVYDMIYSALDGGGAYDKFLEIVAAQGGDVEVIKNAKLFRPYHAINFLADREGYVGPINSLILGEITRRMCKDTHDSNLGIAVRVKVGDYINVGDVVVSFYYKDKSDLKKYQKYIESCVGTTVRKVSPIKVVSKIIR